MTLRVYIAASSREMDRARAAMFALRAWGCEITEDWVAAIEAAGAANEGLSDEDRRRYAGADLRGVADADVFWLLAPETPSAGCWVEMGYALSHTTWGQSPARIIVSGPGRARCIFAALADVEVDTDAAGLEAVLAMAKEAA